MPLKTRFKYRAFLGASQGNPFYDSKLNVGTVEQFSEEFAPANVLDVILNETHPDYAEDGYNVGCVKFRLIDYDLTQPDEALSYAFPISSNITDYPILGETVLITQIYGRYYYVSRINTSNRVTSQAFYGISEEQGKVEQRQNKQSSYNSVSATSFPKKEQPDAINSADTYKDNASLYKLRSKVGDIIYEGRFGQSIRYGSSADKNQAPNMIIRVGQSPTAKKSTNSIFALVDEDINEDLSSIWITTNQLVPLKFSTVDNNIHFKSLEDKNVTLDKNQIILNSDTIVLNSKQSKFIVTSFGGNHFVTLGDHTVDANKNYKSYVNVDRILGVNRNYEINVNKDYLLTVAQNSVSRVKELTRHDTQGNHSIRANKFYLGSISDESEPLVLGESLRQLLLEFVNAHLDNASSHTLPTVGLGPLSPSTVAALQSVKQKLTKVKDAPFESTNAFHPKREGWQVPQGDQ